MHDELNRQFPLGEDGKTKIDVIIKRMQKNGKERKYDCIVGVSGGVDSTFCLYIVKKMGLRPLAIHFDNGWDSEASISNIDNAVRTLDVDLITITVNFEEFKDVQRSFLVASVPDAEAPTDLAIHSVLYKMAAEHNIKWIINGMNFRTEGIQPLEWSYSDGRYVKSVHRIFGQLPFATFPNLTIPAMINYTLLKRIRTVPLLAYMDFSKDEARELLKREVGWTDYGGHHFESIYTRFVITDVLWNKFGIDKRMIQLSAAVRSGKMAKVEALAIIGDSPMCNEVITAAVIEKLGFTKDEFESVLALPRKTFLDYPTSYPLIRMLKWPIKLACSLNLVPKIFYKKYIEART